MDSAESQCTRLLVAAFDFGTTFSGYAFSFQHDPLDIKYNPAWVAGSEKLISLKTPTCVLLKPDKEFHSFGFEAENKYSELTEDDEHHGWYMFRRFKMMLYETKDLRLDTEIEDISGKKMPALTIFGHSIRYLNEHLLKTVCKQKIGMNQEDIQYVITVPAIWDQKAKQFMRKAAVQGGIKDNQLKIALEPEAASIWCQVATDDILSGLADPGSKYMVVDLGGGTADITVHEKLANGTLKEIHKASGGSWGGVEVDKAYLQMLTNVVGNDAMQKFKKEYVGDYFDVLRDFETKKRSITANSDGKMTFKIPAVLKDCAESKGNVMKTLVENSPYKGRMTWINDKIRIEKTLAKSLFDDAINNLSEYVKTLLEEPLISDLDAVLLVGGFGESELVRAAFQKFVRCRLVVPSDAGLAVLKGAVRFGHFPEIVSARVARYTYGREAWPTFDAKLHDEGRKVLCDNDNYACKEVFHKWVTLGDEISVGKEVSESVPAAFTEQEDAVLYVYSSKDTNPRYVTEEGCSLLGKIQVEFPRSIKLQDKQIIAYITFGDTELKVKVVLPKNNETKEIAIDCL